MKCGMAPGTAREKLRVELPKESADLVMLCSKHHRLLHEGGFEIKPGASGE